MAKLTFQRLQADGRTATQPPFEVEYNPTELAFSKSAQFADIAIPGLDSPITQFVRGDAETLSLELFFDNTDKGTGAKAPSVADKVTKFQKLVGVDGNLHAPPVVRLMWGDGFPGSALGDDASPAKRMDVVVTSLARRYTLFGPGGRPLRATVTLQLKQYWTLTDQLKTINFRSADHTRAHVVREGETLPLIAWDAYADPAKWRVIAAYNALDDVRDLAPGQLLQLPPVV